MSIKDRILRKIRTAHPNGTSIFVFDDERIDVAFNSQNDDEYDWENHDVFYASSPDFSSTELFYVKHVMIYKEFDL